MEGLSDEALKTRLQEIDREQKLLEAEILRRARATNVWQTGRALFDLIQQPVPKPVPPKLVTDEDGYTTVRVCKACKSEMCTFSYRPADYPPNWKPKFHGTDKNGKTFVGTILFLQGLECDDSWDESRQKIIAKLNNLRTCSIHVRAGKPFATVVCYTHKEALKAREMLSTDYTVNFFCSNIPHNEEDDE